MKAKEGYESFTYGNDPLYTINECASICGISRATLLRLDELGLEKPHYTNPDNGFRYYDIVNIYRIKQYQMLKYLGLNQSEIIAYYNGQIDPEAFIEKLNIRFILAKRCMDEFSSRFTERGSITYAFMDLLEVTCYRFHCPIADIREQGEYNYNMMFKAHSEGFKPAAATPMFFSYPDFESIYDGSPYGGQGYDMCLSIDPDYIPDSSKTIRFEHRKAFSMTYHGNDREILRQGGQMLYKKLINLGLIPNGPLLGMSVVGPLLGKDIDPSDYVFRFAIPIIDPNETDLNSI